LAAFFPKKPASPTSSLTSKFAALGGKTANEAFAGAKASISGSIGISSGDKQLGIGMKVGFSRLSWRPLFFELIPDKPRKAPMVVPPNLDYGVQL
jgi:hypothetical protein